MNRKLYVPTFITFATTFVPVLLNFGLVVYAVPAAYIALFVGGTLVRGKFAQAFWSFGHLAIYLLIYYAAARLVFWLSERTSSPVLQRTVQIVALLALFSCSFVRAITYSSIQGGGGTYTFWTAVSRYLDKHHSR
ncbi:MAG: hypothetical protein QE274_12600 [Verrucomicrobiaceae bacterium]|jgi:low temperature requirement protein LtrA|nr:hypothetical protein [Verrucomicrobiaceae bacterium]